MVLVLAQKDNYSETPLHLAAFNGHNDMIHFLFHRGAVIDAKNEDSDTPLHEAARKGHKEVVLQLINYGTAVDAENIRLCT
jgi:ankyrin repeat protein